LNIATRMNPDFLIIGCQKCGTTSIYNYLIQHPKILSAYKKEVKYFNLNFQKSLSWYKSHFPLQKKGYISGEATPDYIIYESAAQQISNLFPSVKLLVIMRNPVERTISHYNFNVQRGVEKLPFKEALFEESTRIKTTNKVTNINGHSNSYFSEYTYKLRSRYVEQVQCWLKYFPISSFYFLSLEELRQATNNQLNLIFDFLGLEGCKVENKTILNQSKINTFVKQETKIKLHNYYKPHNEKLFKLINKRFNW